MSDIANVVRPSALVATVIDGGLRIAINKGRNAGIERGDQFLVVHQGPEILDPETQESLGRLELIRGRGKITQVEEKFSILESIETRQKRMISSVGIYLSTGEREAAPFDKVSVRDLVKPV